MGHFWLFWPEWAIFGVWIGFDNCFGVNSCSLKIFILNVSVNSDIWFWLNFWVFFYFFGPKWTFLRGRGRFENCFGVYFYIVEQLSFSKFASILTFDFDLNLVSFFPFGGPNGFFWYIFKWEPSHFQMYLC